MCATIISPAPPPNLVGSERNVGPLVYQGTQTVRPQKSRLVMQPYSLHQIDYSASRLTSKVACALMQAFYHPDDQNEAREWRRSSVESAMSEVIIHTHLNPCATLSAYILAQYRVLHSLYAAPVIQTSALIASIPDVMTEPTIARNKVCEWTHAHAHAQARTHARTAPWHTSTLARAHTHTPLRALSRQDAVASEQQQEQRLQHHLRRVSLERSAGSPSPRGSWGYEKEVEALATTYQSPATGGSAGDGSLSLSPARTGSIAVLDLPVRACFCFLCMGRV